MLGNFWTNCSENVSKMSQMVSVLWLGFGRTFYNWDFKTWIWSCHRWNFKAKILISRSGFAESLPPASPSPWTEAKQAPLPTPTLPAMPATSGEVVEPETLSFNKRNIQKWEKDEPLGKMATISPVLYCNINHPDLKEQHPGRPPSLYSLIKVWFYYRW